VSLAQLRMTLGQQMFVGCGAKAGFTGFTGGALPERKKPPLGFCSQLLLSVKSGHAVASTAGPVGVRTTPSIMLSSEKGVVRREAVAVGEGVDTRVSVTLDSLLCICVLMCLMVWLCHVLCLSPPVPSAMWLSSCD
jgi:hypothetical protein